MSLTERVLKIWEMVFVKEERDLGKSPLTEEILSNWED